MIKYESARTAGGRTGTRQLEVNDSAGLGAAHEDAAQIEIELGPLIVGDHSRLVATIHNLCVHCGLLSKLVFQEHAEVAEDVGR